MKILDLWMVALVALSLSFTFVSCSDDNDDTDNTEQTKVTVGAYKGYSIGKSRMSSDCLMGDDISATITASIDDTVNLVYKPGLGDFILNSLTVSSKLLRGEGEVALAMEEDEPADHKYTLEDSVSDAKVPTLKANVPTPMDGIDINFIQAKTPIVYYIVATYKYNTNLAISVMESSHGSTEDCKAVIRRAFKTTINTTLSGFDNLTEGGDMDLGDFAISGVNVEEADNGYTLSLGAFEPTAESASGVTPITGENLEGTATANGKANIMVAFKPRTMPMVVTTVFTRNVKKTGA